MNVEVHLQRIRKGKISYNLSGVVPSIEVESYQEAFDHPEVQQMIQEAYGRYFALTFYTYGDMLTVELRKKNTKPYEH